MLGVIKDILQYNGRLPNFPLRVRELHYAEGPPSERWRIVPTIMSIMKWIIIIIKPITIFLKVSV